MNNLKLIASLLSGTAALIVVITWWSMDAGDMASPGSNDPWQALQDNESSQSVQITKAMERVLASQKGSLPTDPHAHDHNIPLHIEEDNPAVFSDSPTGKKLQAIYFQIDSGNPEDDKHLKVEFEKLRKNKQAAQELVNAYKNLNQDQFLSRYKLLYMAEQFANKELLPFLEEIATSPIPKDLPTFTGDGGIDHYGNEQMIKMRAIGGLATLASEGDQSSRDMLHQIILETSDPTLKQDAIHAYLSSSSDLEKDEKQLKLQLSPEEQGQVTLELTDVENVEALED